MDQGRIAGHAEDIAELFVGGQLLDVDQPGTDPHTGSGILLQGR